ncbi:MAG: outer membrane beta-barrel protein [Salinibacter sp.]
MISHYEPNSMDNLRQTLTSTLLLGAFALFAVSPPQAQAQQEPGASFIGIQGGLAQSSLAGSGVESSTRSGYTQKGATNLQATGGVSLGDALDYTGDKLSLSYLETPLLFKLTAPIEAVRLRAFAGPSYNNVIAATMNGKEELTRLQSNLPVEERISFYDVGGVIGGEIAIPLPMVADEIALDGRYYFGFHDLDTFQGYNFKNRTFSGTISVRFAL